MNARMTSLLYILMEPHKLALAIGYEPDVPISVTVVFVQLILELGLEMTVDVTAMWAESEHGIPMTEYFVHARSPFVGMVHFGAALAAMGWCCIVAFIRVPTVFSCASDDVCECLHLDQFGPWYGDVCESAALGKNHTKNYTLVSTNVSESNVLDEVDVFSIMSAILTAVAMVALIWLSVLFARYRSKNQILAAAVEEKELAKQSKLRIKEAADRAEVIPLHRFLCLLW